jgi:hypothetical protein
VPIEDARDKRAAAARQGHLLGAAIVGVGGALDEAARFEAVDGGGDAAAGQLDVSSHVEQRPRAPSPLLRLI